MDVVEDMLAHHFAAWLTILPVISAKVPRTIFSIFSAADEIAPVSQSIRDL
jgi:hypothetical protein